MSFFLPFGIDRADGKTDLPSQPQGSDDGTKKIGTPDPENMVKVFGDDDRTKVEEYADSPEIERAEQGTFHKRFRTSWSFGLNLLNSLGRGTFVTDTGGNIWRILSSNLKSMRGGYSDLSITAESISFDSPPDDFQITPVNLGVDILKHPRYAWALLPYTTDSSTTTTVGDQTVTFAFQKESIVRFIQTYRDAPVRPVASNINGSIQNSILNITKNKGTGKNYIDVSVPNPNFDASLLNGKKPPDPVTWNGLNASLISLPNCEFFILKVPVDMSDDSDPIHIAIQAAKEIISKLWRSEDTPPISGYEIVWSQYYFAPVFLNPGNYIENPFGIIPMYFMSPSQDGTDSIFDEMVLKNPQCFSSNRTTEGVLDLSCLRCPDEVDYQRTWFKVTRKWLCSPVGHWDRDLLSGLDGPQVASDYNIPY